MKESQNGSLRLAICVLVCCALFTGCSSFNYDWNHSAATPSPAGDLVGRWQGVWKSEASGHTDQLRCLITKTDASTYEARFHAKYHTVLSFGYSVPLKVEKTDNGFKFSGQADLGMMAGGMYQYEGHAEATNFFSTYSSKEDHGTFQMGRP